MTDTTGTVNNYVCADCGHEQDSMNRRCDRCHSIRVVAISFAELHFGPNWRDCFKPRPSGDATT